MRFITQAVITFCKQIVITVTTRSRNGLRFAFRDIHKINIELKWIWK